MYKTALKPCFAGKIQGGGKKKGQILATFCYRAPKTKVYKHNFWKICNFKQNQGSILEIFEKNSQFMKVFDTKPKFKENQGSSQITSQLLKKYKVLQPFYQE